MHLRLNVARGWERTRKAVSVSSGDNGCSKGHNVYWWDLCVVVVVSVDLRVIVPPSIERACARGVGQLPNCQNFTRAPSCMHPSDR